MTLGSLAMAAESQILTVIPDHDVISTEKNDKGSYDSVVFKLLNNGARTTVLSGDTLTSTVTLKSIEIAGKDKDTALAGLCPILTEADGTIIAMSYTKTAITSKTHASDWEWAYTRPYVTLTDFMKPGEDNIVLTLGKEYRIYLGSESQVYNVGEALMLAAMGMWQDPTVNINKPYEEEAAGGFYTQKAFAVTTIGVFDGASANEYGLMNGGSIPGETWAPLMGVTVENINVPEPTTGTLSLLALAGLCIRRRK